MRPARGETIFVLAFCLLNVLIPLAVTDLYPFSIFPMLSGTTERISTVKLLDPDGEPLSTEDFQIWTLNVINPRVRVGRMPEVLDPGVVLMDEDVLGRHVNEMLSRQGLTIAYVDVEQKIYGVQPDGTIGVVAERQWRVLNDAAP